MELALIGLMWLLGLASLVFFIMVVVKMFQHGQTGMGVVCIVLAICSGIGTLIAFVVGWMNAKQWGIQNIMMYWTIAFIGQIILMIAVFAMFGMDAMMGGFGAGDVNPGGL